MTDLGTEALSEETILPDVDRSDNLANNLDPISALCLSDQVCMSMQDATRVDTNATLTLG